MTTLRFKAFGSNILILASLVLILGSGLIIYGQSPSDEPTFHAKLADILPPAPEGWIRIEHPIADTPEMEQKVDELLNFDDGIFYIYSSGPLRISVYAAYWKPGKMASRLVAGHSPDICWTSSGWKCTARLTSNHLTLNGETLPSVETRTFTVNQATEHVWFWHLVDGKPQSYGSRGKIAWHAMFTDMLQRGLNQRQEQFFIRISSPQELDSPSLKIARDAILQALPLHNAQSSAVR